MNRCHCLSLALATVVAAWCAGAAESKTGENPADSLPPHITQVTGFTFFSDFPCHKASNPVVSDDGRFFAFQMATSREAAGVGQGIFVYQIEKAKRSTP